jgi:prevent-host-death family protein
MKQISAAEFKARCLALMDDVSTTGETILITKRGKAVAQLAPAKQRCRNILGSLRGKVKVKGKITDPAIPPEDWKQG